MSFQKMDKRLFRELRNLKLDLLYCIILLKYLETWGIERTSLRHKLAMAYLLNLELQTRNFCDRFSLTYVYIVNKGVETNFFDRLINFYIVKRGLQTHSLFGLISKGFLHLLKRRRHTNSVFDKMAIMYLIARCDEAVYEGLSMSGLGEVFDLGKVEGKNFINHNLERLSKTPMAFETAKIAIAYRSVLAFESETPDGFVYNLELGYWTGALERLHELEKEEN
uniref:Uncharacterized protein n=1 Tax=Lobelia puberula TaxID=113203 RepID=A0A291EZW7_LOBPU|nr:hypothetical protein Lo_pub1Pt0547 [Lobelia puberula]ATG25411.1 hypothetical protein Lo_pub1Pt0547 [Lobelia puberula]